jgi:hypothetical protein
MYVLISNGTLGHEGRHCARKTRCSLVDHSCEVMVTDHVGAWQSDEARLSPLHQYCCWIAEVPGDAGGVEARGSRVHGCPRPRLATSAYKDQIDGDGMVAWGSFRCTLAAVVAVRPKHCMGAALWL